MSVRQSSEKIHYWLSEPLAKDVKQSLKRLAALLKSRRDARQ
jgi:hypothetical protein